MSESMYDHLMDNSIPVMIFEDLSVLVVISTSSCDN